MEQRLQVGDHYGFSWIKGRSKGLSHHGRSGQIQKAEAGDTGQREGNKNAGNRGSKIF